jgi:nitrate reductase gamma subunit
MRSNQLFSLWPYIATAVFIVGLGVCFTVAPSRVADQEGKPSALRALFGKSKTWTLGLTTLFLLHFVELIFPQSVVLWDRVSARLYVLEGAALFLGLVTLSSGVFLAFRYLRSSANLTVSECADGIFLSLLLVGVLSGILMAVSYRWASSWGTATLTPYVFSLGQGYPAVEFVVPMPFLVRLHVFSAFTALAAFPFTRISSLLAAAIYGGLAGVMRPFRVWAEERQAAITPWVRAHNPMLWILQNEED